MTTRFFRTPRITAKMGPLLVLEELQCAYSILVPGYGAAQLEKTTAEEWKDVSVKVWEWNKLWWKKLLREFVALIDQLARWIIDFLRRESIWLQLQTCYKSCAFNLCPQIDLKACLCAPQQPIAALHILIVPIRKATSAVIDQEPSYAECLDRMTTWCPTQMVVVMSREGGLVAWMIQHMHSSEHTHQE